MNSYSRQHSPAAPVSLVTLRNIDTLATIRDIIMLLDTGSDVSLLPISLCRELGIDALTGEPLDLEGFDGSISTGFYVKLALLFGGKQFRGNFIAFDQTEGILGCNVLNAFSILHDGPNLEWDFVKA